MRKFSVILLSVLVIVVSGGMLLFYLMIDERRVEEFIEHKLGPGFSVSAGKAVFNPFTRTLTVEGLSVVHVRRGTERELFRAGNMTVGRIHILASARGRFSAGSLFLRDFWLDGDALERGMESERGMETGRGPETERRPPNPAPVYLHSIELRSGQIAYDGRNAGTGNMQLGKFIAGPFEYRPECVECKPWSHLENIGIEISEVEYLDRSGDYVLRGKDLTVDENHSLAILGEFSLEPLRSVQERLERGEHRKEFFRFAFTDFQITGLDFNAFRTHGAIQAVSAALDSVDFHAVLDKRLPEDPDRELPVMPAEAFRRLPVSLAVDTFKISDADIRYSEYAVDGVRPGTILFEKTKLELTGLDSRSETPALLQIRSVLEGSGELNAEFTIPLTPDELLSEVTGTLGSFDITLLNKVFEDLEGIRIRSGQIHDLKFDYKMTRSQANGFVEIEYEDLQIEFIDKADSGQNLADAVKSFFVDQLSLRASSGGDGEESRRGEISIEREEEKGFFNYLWGSLRSGIYDVVRRF